MEFGISLITFKIKIKINGIQSKKYLEPICVQPVPYAVKRINVVRNKDNNLKHKKHKF